MSEILRQREIPSEWSEGHQKLADSLASAGIVRQAPYPGELITDHLILDVDGNPIGVVTTRWPTFSSHPVIPTDTVNPAQAGS